MDDPWGSPWVSTDTAPKNDPIPSPSKDILSLPPKAFFGGPSNFTNHAPWVDDDGFGGWAAADQAEPAALSPGWGTWADSGLQALQLTPRLDSPGKASPIAWPSSAAPSPGITSGLRSRASSVFRQASPDPWATESPWNDKEDDMSPAIVPRSEKANEDDKSNELQDQEISNCLVIQIDEPELAEANLADSNIKDNGRKSEENACNTPRKQTEYDGLSHGNPAAGLELSKIPSRSSSTFSFDSEREIDHQESPLTSIDEEPIFRPQPPRKVSGKIGELVGLFNGLAKAVEEEPPLMEKEAPSMSRGRARSVSRAILNAEDAPGEPATIDLDSTHALPSRLSRPSTSSGSGRSLTPKARLKSEFVPSGAGSAQYKTTAPKSSSIPVQQLSDQSCPIKFDINIQNIDKLFSNLLKPGDDVQDCGGISDRIVTDTFSTIEERKTWYRISRYGSMRKHNSGEDENYHPVTWQTSRLHDDTMKIVRRWMEEDSFAGKPTFGGGKRASGFNWDSTAPSFELEKVFARKPKSSHSRASSTAIPPHSSNCSTPSISFADNAFSNGHAPTGSISSLRSGGTIASPIPSFDWNSTAIEFQSASSPESTISLPKPPHPSKPLAFTPIPDSRPVSVEPPPSIFEEGHIDDDDDEWGEMIASPAIDTFNALDIGFPPESAKHSLDMSDASHVPVYQQPTAARRSLALASVSSSLSESTRPSLELETLDCNPGDIPKTTDSTTPFVDPWATADFSFLGGPSKSKHSPKPITRTPVLKPKISNSYTPKKSTPLSRMAFPPSKPAAKVVLGPVEDSSKEDQEQDQLVREIISNLPNLTYMLR